MSILLLAECWPFRNCAIYSFDNSEGRELAYNAGISIQKLEELCTCRYVFEYYVPSYKRKFDRYNHELGLRLSCIWRSYGLEYDITLLVGKRLAYHTGMRDIPFFQVHFAKALRFAVIPNPAAKFWWDDPDHVAQYKGFMVKMFNQHGGTV